MPKPSFKKNSCGTIQHSWDVKGVHTFSKGICPKENVIARLEFELAYYDFAIKLFNEDTPYTIGILIAVCKQMIIINRNSYVKPNYY